MKKLALNSMMTFPCTLEEEIAVTKHSGFDGLELAVFKLENFLSRGGTIAQVKEMMGDLPMSGLCNIKDGDRVSPEERKEFVEEIHKVCGYAHDFGCEYVQFLPGPDQMQGALTPELCREGLTKQEWSVVRREIGKNLRTAAEIAKPLGLNVALEMFGWLPYNSMEQAIEIVDEAGMDNAGVVLDFWHSYVAGDSLDYIAKLDKNYIKLVHICDSNRYDGGVPNQGVLRDVMTGAGVICLSEWFDAVNATGFDGWSATESFSRRHYEANPYEYGKIIHDMLAFML